MKVSLPVDGRDGKEKTGSCAEQEETLQLDRKWFERERDEIHSSRLISCCFTKVEWLRKTHP